MNIHVTGVMLSNDTQMTRMLNFHPYFRETVILNNFYKIHDEKCSFCRSAQQELNVSYEISIFRSIFMWHSFVYTSGHCRRWRSRMEVKIMAGSLFVHCKIVYIYSVTAEKWLVVSLPNFVTIRRTHLSISCKIFSWIRTTKLKIYAMEFCDFI